MSTAFVFPGQGSQAVGMGQALATAFPAARAVFETLDVALGERLSDVIFHGPEAELTLTANAQPALMAVSLAALRVLETEVGVDLAGDVAFVAGHSLGEYTALAAAGAFGTAQTAKLLRTRGTAMQNAVPVGHGAMAALIGVDAQAAGEIANAAAEGEVCDVANDNGGGQVVLSGTAAAIGRAIELAKARGVKRAVRLPVSAPFHCRLMSPAAVVMAQVLAESHVRDPSVPLVSNVTARPVATPKAIVDGLTAQVCGTVRWRESVEWLSASGVTRFVEIGAGKVLSGLIKRISPSATTLTVGTPDDVKAFVTAWR